MKLRIVNKEPITEEWSIERVAKEYPPYGWRDVFKNAEAELKSISNDLEEDRELNGRRIPSNSVIFKAFHLTPLDKVRVVIIGMDPYHSTFSNNRDYATGMAFSVPHDAPIPSSLRNIFKELKDCIPDFKYTSGDLTSWATQGVLLLNASLTVRPGSAGCFKELWHGFIKKVIRAILDVNPKCIFVAWGGDAQKLSKKFIGERATILSAAHPSGLSCHRGFFGCKHFSEINRLLVLNKMTPINWNIE